MTTKTPVTTLYGSQTTLALENFALTGIPFGRNHAFVDSLATVKSAAALANASLGLLTPDVAAAIQQAAAEMRAGDLSRHLVVDELEGSGGTSINMNVNEVLAARANELLFVAGDKSAPVHPNDAVNLSQSTNDVIPTAIKMTCRTELAPLVENLLSLSDSFSEKADEFSQDLRLGRTCLQDAQPMPIGASFGAYAAVLQRHAKELIELQEKFCEIPLGATAIGTGFGADPKFREIALKALTNLTGLSWEAAPNLFDALSNADIFARLSGQLRNAATTLAKIGNDLQILSSGPAGGIGEIQLPEVQAGSSIMPGKVNPVMPMTMCQIGFVITGYDAIISHAVQQGQLEINPYEPVIGAYLFKSICLLTNGAALFRERCVRGLSIDRERAEYNLRKSSALATALIPRLGYENVSRIVRESQTSGRNFTVIAKEKGLLLESEAQAILDEAAGLSRA